MTIPDIRHFNYAEEIMALSGAKLASLRTALSIVPREDFLPPGPWLIESLDGIYYPSDDADPRHVLHGVGVAVDPVRMLNNANPVKFAVQMQMINPQPGETVFHVGAGLGYFSALFGALVGRQGRVVAAEIDPAIRARAALNLVEWPQVEVVGDALEAAPEAFDILYSSAGMATLPLAWLRRLRVGGRMVVPITGPHDHGLVFLIQKTAEDKPWPARMLSFTRHYPCIGTRGEAELEALGRALSKPPSMVSCLRLDAHAPEGDCWLHGDGWCLSSKPVS